MSDIFETYKRLEKDNILLAFRGVITEDLITSVFSIIGSKLEMSSVDVKLKKKVNNILIECLQNVYHHIEDFKSQENADDFPGTAMFLVCAEGKNRFRIITGNHILNANVDKLKSRIDHVNSLSRDDLKVHYREALKNTELSSKGTAGLGLIDMARKSGNKIEYNFDKVNDNLSFFSLQINVD